jgi:hypothetical protein
MITAEQAVAIGSDPMYADGLPVDGTRTLPSYSPSSPTGVVERRGIETPEGWVEPQLAPTPGSGGGGSGGSGGGLVGTAVPIPESGRTETVGTREGAVPVGATGDAPSAALTGAAAGTSGRDTMMTVVVIVAAVAVVGLIIVASRRRRRK